MSGEQRNAVLVLVLSAVCSLCACALAVFFVVGRVPETSGTNSSSKIAPQSDDATICTKPRFGSRLSPDDVDILLNEGEVIGEINPVWGVAVRFDCPGISSERIDFKWYFNKKTHCTRTRITNDCDRSSLTEWKSLPGKYLVNLYSKDFPDDLDTGKYTFAVFVDGQEVISGTVSINP